MKTSDAPLNRFFFALWALLFAAIIFLRGGVDCVEVSSSSQSLSLSLSVDGNRDDGPEDWLAFSLLLSGSGSISADPLSGSGSTSADPLSGSGSISADPLSGSGSTWADPLFGGGEIGSIWLLF